MRDTLEQDQSASAVETVRLRIPASGFVIAVWQRRKWLVAVAGIGVLISIAVSLVIPPAYSSTAELMPIDPQSFSTASPTDMLSGSLGELARESSLMSGVTPGATAIGVLNSPTELDEIIDKFNLRDVYHLKTLVDTRSRLLAQTRFTEDKNSGIVTIVVQDGDRFRAQAIAQAYVEELNHLVESLNSSSAHRERVFLEARLKSLKDDLDATELKLAQFSSHSGTLNPQSQGQALIMSATQLQSQLIAAESELQGLREVYGDDNVRVRQARARVDELHRQIQEMGTQEDSSKPSSGQPYPSMRQLPALGTTYLDFSRELATEDDAYKVLTQRYELAKVQEAEELPRIIELVQPEVAERRTSPRRTVIVILGMFISLFAALGWIITSMIWTSMGESHPAKATLKAITQAIKSRESL